MKKERKKTRMEMRKEKMLEPMRTKYLAMTKSYPRKRWRRLRPRLRNINRMEPTQWDAHRMTKSQVNTYIKKIVGS